MASILALNGCPGSVDHYSWTFKQGKPGEKWFVVVARVDKDWSPSAAEKESYSLVMTVADRDNEQAQLYTQIHQRIAEQAVVREQERAKQAAARLNTRG
jgi:hypothetical protein